MSGMTPLPVFFQNEWDRLVEGLKRLDPTYLASKQLLSGRVPVPADGAHTITIPGWDDVLHFGASTPVGSAEFGEYYKSLREGRPPKLTPDELHTIQKMINMKAANLTSAVPGWAQSIGQIMTSLDNVQDFLSTLATVGRLLIWAAPRIGLRAVPVVGWIVTAADILNMIGFFGMIATPLYGLLCTGPKEALLAGVPAALLKNALCKEAWTMAKLNPFSRAGRASAKMRAMGRLPSVSNLIEVAQTTDNLFGWGLQIGALYGTAMELLFTAANDPTFKSTTVNTTLLTNSFGGNAIADLKTATVAERDRFQKAAGVSIYAPLIASKNDHFPDDVHLSHMAAQIGAVSVLHDFFTKHPPTAAFADLLAGEWPAPTRSPSFRREMFGDATDDDLGIGRWWYAGNPRTMRGEDFILTGGAQVTRAVHDYLEPRRNRLDSTFYGATLNQLTENWWGMIGQSPDALKWRLEPDFTLATTLMVEGLLIRQGEPEGPLWKFWTAARARILERDHKMLERQDLLELAGRAGITLMRLLPTDRTFPPEWDDYFKHPAQYRTVDVGADREALAAAAAADARSHQALPIGPNAETR